jgi:hypothetical protein
MGSKGISPAKAFVESSGSKQPVSASVAGGFGAGEPGDAGGVRGPRIESGAQRACCIDVGVDARIFRGDGAVDGGVDGAIARIWELGRLTKVKLHPLTEAQRALPA